MQKFQEGNKFDLSKLQGDGAGASAYAFGTNMMMGIGDGMLEYKDPLNANDAAASDYRAQTRQAAMSSGNPIAMAAAGADSMLDAMGGYSQASNTGTSADVTTAIASRIPGLGFFSKKVDTITVSDEMKAMSGGYKDAAAQVTQASSNSGGKFFGKRARKKINAQIREAKEMQKKINNIKHEADDAFEIQQSMAGVTANRVNNQMAGGPNPLARAAEHGAKLEPALPEDLIARVLAEAGIPEQFKDGGAINVIPTGALHAQLHHMEDAGELTKKGIPVVDENGTQQAEIERNEIIFHLDLTKQLEQMADNYKKLIQSDSKAAQAIAIEAGKLLTEEILHNTDDKTKLIKQTK